MDEPAEFPNREEHRYTDSLLQERIQELRSVELKHRRKLIPKKHYLSCRCSLLQAIGELKTVLRSAGSGRHTLGAHASLPIDQTPDERTGSSPAGSTPQFVR